MASITRVNQNYLCGSPQENYKIYSKVLLIMGIGILIIGLTSGLATTGGYYIQMGIGAGTIALCLSTLIPSAIFYAKSKKEEDLDLDRLNLYESSGKNQIKKMNNSKFTKLLIQLDKQHYTKEMLAVNFPNEIIFENLKQHPNWQHLVEKTNLSTHFKHLIIDHLNLN